MSVIYFYVWLYEKLKSKWEIRCKTENEWNEMASGGMLVCI